MAPIGSKLWENAFQMIPDISSFNAENQKKMPNFEWPFTPRIWLRSASNFGKMRFRRFPTFHFSTPKKFFWQFFLMKIFVTKKNLRKIDKLPVFAELWIFGRNRQMRLEKLPPKFWFSTLYDFWRRGKRDSFNFCPDFRPKMTSTLSVFGLKVLCTRQFKNRGRFWNCYSLRTEEGFGS